MGQKRLARIASPLPAFDVNEHCLPEGRSVCLLQFVVFKRFAFDHSLAEPNLVVFQESTQNFLTSLFSAVLVLSQHSRITPSCQPVHPVEMPPPTPVDYYAELHVERSATQAQITSSYRRLAMIHHPDKNPDNQEEATTIFQRIQLAYETLSDPVKRARYDNTPPGEWSPTSGQEEDGLWDGPFGLSPLLFSFLFRPFFAPPNFTQPPRQGSSRGQAARDDRKAQQERRAQENKRREEAKELREKEQRLRREAEEAREKAAEQSRALERRRVRDDEFKRQEKRWEEMGAVSRDDRLRTCLHSEVCDKVQHTKKFKCTSCSARRGMIAFECPHCSAFLCQLCHTKFSEKRGKLEVEDQMKKQDTPKDSAGSSSKPTVNNHNASKPMTGKSATKKPMNKKATADNSAQKIAKGSVPGKSGNSNTGGSEGSPGLSEVDEDKVAPTSGGHFASDNPYNILADDKKTASLYAEKSAPDANTLAQTAAPLANDFPDGAKVEDGNPASSKLAQSKSKKKRQNKKSAGKDSVKENVNLDDKARQVNTDVALERDATGVVDNTHRQSVAPGSTEFSFKNAAAHSVPNNTVKHDMKINTSNKPQQPKHHSVPSRQEKPSGTHRGPPAAATRGYIRALGQAQSPTVAALREAMEKFGAVSSLRIMNKRRGTAHVDFATHDALRRAMSASPVVISEQVTVRVVEWRQHDTGVKADHVAKGRGDTKSKGFD